MTETSCFPDEAKMARHLLSDDREGDLERVSYESTDE
jgi:ribosome biogenesis GTPase A